MASSERADVRKRLSFWGRGGGRGRRNVWEKHLSGPIFLPPRHSPGRAFFLTFAPRGPMQAEPSPGDSSPFKRIPSDINKLCWAGAANAFIHPCEKRGTVESFLRGERERNVIKFLWNIDHFSQEKTFGTLEVRSIHLNPALKSFPQISAWFQILKEPKKSLKWSWCLDAL